MCLYSFNNANNSDKTSTDFNDLQSIYEAIANNDKDKIINLTQAFIDKDPNNMNNGMLQDYIESLK